MLLAVFTVFAFNGYAQPGNPVGEPDEPPVPIDDYIPHFIVLAVALAGYWFYKQAQKEKKLHRSEY